MWSSWPFIFSTLPLQDVRSHAQNSIPMAKVSAPALSVLAFAASVMASPCFVAPRSPLSSPGQATSLHVKAEAAFKAETASTRWTSSGLVLPATFLAAGIGRRRQCRRHARSAKVVRQVIGPAVAAAAAAAKVAAAGKLAAAGGGAAAVAAGIKTLSKKRPTEHRSGERKKMVILGTGWGSVTFLQGLSEDIAKFYDITVVSWLSFCVKFMMYHHVNAREWTLTPQDSSVAAKSPGLATKLLFEACLDQFCRWVMQIKLHSAWLEYILRSFEIQPSRVPKNIVAQLVQLDGSNPSNSHRLMKLKSCTSTKNDVWNLNARRKNHGITYQLQRDSSLHQQEILVILAFRFRYTPLLPASTMGSIEERSIVTPIRRVLKGKAATWIWHLQDTLCCSNASYVSWDFPSSIWTWPQFSSRGHDDFKKQMPPQADFLEAKCEHVDVKNKVLRCGIWYQKVT